MPILRSSYRPLVSKRSKSVSIVFVSRWGGGGGQDRLEMMETAEKGSAQRSSDSGAWAARKAVPGVHDVQHTNTERVHFPHCLAVAKSERYGATHVGCSVKNIRDKTLEVEAGKTAYIMTILVPGRTDGFQTGSPHLPVRKSTLPLDFAFELGGCNEFERHTCRCGENASGIAHVTIRPWQSTIYVFEKVREVLGEASVRRTPRC
ncbi:hypothetical protein BXZ70DRAFT_910402 [Cristinia sonorae]|uniref:Uncharacterized protein n=1 Tax=Cristinia sonorae TaxID=1940300 RepID=A0A8K0UFM3_9AGAR|nr:hypothetical protein BXZ70DRAFT_910402 [Cristinia sonorae]